MPLRNSDRLSEVVKVSSSFNLLPGMRLVLNRESLRHYATLRRRIGASNDWCIINKAVKVKRVVSRRSVNARDYKVTDLSDSQEGPGAASSSVGRRH